jgi:hypothetical protein
MKKIPSNQMTSIGSLMTWLLSIAGITFLLQSCCFMTGGLAKSAPCNCGNKKPDYAANKQPQKPTMNEAASRTVPATTNQQHDLILPHTSPTVKAEQIPLPFESGSQMHAEKKLPLGIKGIRSHIIAGPNLSFKSSDEDYGGTDHKNKSGTGFQLGFGSTLMFSDKFAVSTGLVFKKNNASEVLSYPSTGEPGGGTSTQEYESKYSYSYLSIPIVAEYKLTDQLSAIAGPEVNFLTGASVKASGYGNTEKTDIKDYSVKTGISVKAGIQFSIPKSPIAVQVVYDQRLSRLNEKSESYYPGSSYDTPAWKMKDVSVSVVCDICNLMKALKK